MKDQFSEAAMTRFGSGWAWLCVTNGQLSICSTPNQDNPLMLGDGIPILGLDVWEHAYYKNYGPGRGDYIAAWWNVVNWSCQCPINTMPQYSQIFIMPTVPL